MVEVGSAISNLVWFTPFIVLLKLYVPSKLEQRRKNTNMNHELLDHVSQVHTMPHVKALSTNISKQAVNGDDQSNGHYRFSEY